MKSYNQFVTELNDLATQKANNAAKRKELQSNLKSSGQANIQKSNDIAARGQAERDIEKKIEKQSRRILRRNLDSVKHTIKILLDLHKLKSKVRVAE